jgi:hypothetical protein
MNHYQKKSPFIRASAGWLWILVFCTPVMGNDAGESGQAVDKAAIGTAPNEEQTHAEPQDIIDRMLSPLDNAVSDINRDLNKGDAGASPEPNE